MNTDPVPAKMAYEPPALVRLGSLEDLTKSYEDQFWHWPKPWHHPPPPACFS